MSTLLDIRPLDPEPLPLYSRQDPDTASIRSAAPSYVSDTPTYRSYRTPTSLLPPLSPGQQTIGLPAPRIYAPGFAPELRNRASGSASENIFSTTRTSSNSKQYSAVARRRTAQARADTEAMLNSLSAVPPSPPSPTTAPSSPYSTDPSANIYPVQINPLSPLEDPYLVGEEAADQARRSRVYREMCAREAETSRHESRSWDFMVSQMSDWEERRHSWNSFKSNIPKRGKGLRKFGWRL